MARLTLRVDFGDQRAVGPGKIRLLELIDKHGSIAAAGRAMRMSYRRAWLLIDNLNQCFRKPLVQKQMGGDGGGGAALTPFGRRVVKHYRDMEQEASSAVVRHLLRWKMRCRADGGSGRLGSPMSCPRLTRASMKPPHDGSPG
jgi:molybdate transport system regulatory protein